MKELIEKLKKIQVDYYHNLSTDAINTLTEAIQALSQSEGEKELIYLLEKLLENNMCSQIGDELIREVLEKSSNKQNCTNSLDDKKTHTKKELIKFGYECLSEIEFQDEEIIYKKVPEEIYNNLYVIPQTK